MGLREEYEANEREELVELNFNNFVLVKLTEHGKKICDQYFLSRGLKPNDYIEMTEDGFLKTHLWRLMRIFGSEMHKGNPVLPFESMDFKIEMKKKVTSVEKKPDFGGRVLDVIDKN